MPNWVQQKVIVKGDAERVEHLHEHLRRHSSFCQVVLPMPFEFASSEGHDWVNWAISHWGTKWEIADIARLELEKLADESKRRLSFRCNTAYAPPVGVWNELVRLGLSVAASYADDDLSYYGFYENGDNQRRDITTPIDSGIAKLVSYMLDIEIDE